MGALEDLWIWVVRFFFSMALSLTLRPFAFLGVAYIPLMGSQKFTFSKVRVLSAMVSSMRVEGCCNGLAVRIYRVWVQSSRV